MKKSNTVDRRHFLKSLGLVGLIGPAYTYNKLGGVVPVDYLTGLSNGFKLNPVNVRHERVIRTVVGLRPFRPAGYHLKAENLGDKMVVHNYGHGGGGISLSWGTAQLAVDKITAEDIDSVAVIGCGVIGLSTAILLQKRGYKVTIYTKDFPENTTSSVAAAFWAPVSVYDSRSITTGFKTEFDMASEISQRMFQTLVGERYGVWWIKNYFVDAKFDFPGGEHLYPAKSRPGDLNAIFSSDEIQEVRSLMIEPPIYLRALMDDFLMMGGEIKVKSFQERSALLGLREKVIMNCTGLGSASLFNDDQLVPVKGQLTVLLPQAEIDYSYVKLVDNDLLYMFPRKDGIILGGTSEKGVWTMDPDPDERQRIMHGHKSIAESIEKANASSK